VTLVRVHLAAAAAGDPSALGDAAGLLDRLITAADAGGRGDTLVELLVLRALATVDRPADALDCLERALRLAEPEGYCRTFTGEGPAMAALLDALAGRHPAWPYLERLRAATRGDGTPGVAPDAPVGGDAARWRPSGPLEPLSARELDILRYLGSELDGPAIARELSVSLSTVRTHTQHVYAKLGVNNRRTAVRRAHQLGLFTRHPVG
jgi:LuxR family maltose regulon positive regulatory protein